jgi:hypothetical protein
MDFYEIHPKGWRASIEPFLTWISAFLFVLKCTQLR